MVMWLAKTQELCSPYQERKADEEDPTVSSKNKKEDPTGPNVTPKQKGEECKLYLLFLWIFKEL